MCSLSILWDTLKEDFNRQGFFQSGSLPGDRQRQHGTVRVNCIDCLDRTNVVQGLLGRKHLESVLDRAGLLDATDILALPNTFPQVCIGPADFLQSQSRLPTLYASGSFCHSYPSPAQDLPIGLHLGCRPSVVTLTLDSLYCNPVRIHASDTRPCWTYIHRPVLGMQLHKS